MRESTHATSLRLLLGVFVVILALVLAARLRASQGVASEGVIHGSIQTAEGERQSGILVTARGRGRNLATTVFSNEQGEYRFPPLPRGVYEVSVGTSWKEEVRLEGPTAERDFTVALGSGFLNQTTGASWARLIPGTEAEKKALYKNCGTCHSFWRLFARPQNSAEGWAVLGRRMARVGVTGVPLGPDQPYRVDLSEENFSALNNYLARTITTELRDQKAFEAMVRASGEGLRAVFTEWDLSKDVAQSDTIWADPKGIIWSVVIGHDGFEGVGRLDVRSGDFQTWMSPLRDAVFHDLMGDKDGNLWITAARANRIVKFDVKSFKYTIWEMPTQVARWPHTGDFDRQGNFWFTLTYGEGAVYKLDPRTGSISEFPAPTKNGQPYGLIVDRRGNIWFTQLEGGKVSKIDPQSGRITEYDPPTPNSGPRRIQMDSKGRLWFSQFYADKVGRLDPETMEWAEFDIGIPGGAPYFLRIDKHDKIWFNLLNGSCIGKFDPESRKFSFFLFPQPESHARDAFFDYSTEPHALVYGLSYVAQRDYKPSIGRLYIR